nr:hypothetical protein [Ruegeria sp. HKCCD7559]
MLDKAREFRCDLVAAFGTALCRRIDEVHPGKLSKGIRVLSKAEEALAALAAGSICEGGRIRNGEVIVVDEGTGSTEIAQGLWTAGGMKNVKSVSFDIGSARLSEMFKAAPSEYLGSIQKHLQYIDERIRESGMNISQSGRLYLLGGVATKIAWLQVRRSPSEYYKPSLVNGFSYPCSRLIDEYKDLYGRYESNPVAAAEYVDDRPEREDEVLRVLSGLPFLALVLLRVYGGQLIRTSAFSIRHGVTFLVCAGALRL